MSNRSEGMKFEIEFCKKLADEGFWVHRLAQTAQGQPFDVIAVKSGIAYAFDCKDCKNDVFSFDRVEPNQETAMQKWKACHNAEPYFALKLSDNTIYLLPYWKYTTNIKGENYSLNKTQILRNTVSLHKWLGSWR